MSEYFFEQLLAIPDLKVDEIFYESSRIILHCHSEQDAPACPQCGSVKDKSVKRYEERQVRDLDISGKEGAARRFGCIYESGSLNANVATTAAAAAFMNLSVG